MDQLSDYSGFIGLQPYSADPDNTQRNFLMMLKSKNLISHMSFSLYTRPGEKNAHSTIKFGGYDKEGLSKNQHLTVLRTIDKYSWAVIGGEMRVGDWMYSEKVDIAERRVIIEPQLPYMYVPAKDFPAISKVLLKMFK